MNASEVTIVLNGPLCRRCVRRFSRRISDVSGVASLRVDARQGRLWVGGSPCGRQVVAAFPTGSVRSYACAGSGPPGAGTRPSYGCAGPAPPLPAAPGPLD